MTAPSTEARRKAREGLVSVRVGAVRTGQTVAAYWVPVDLAETIRRMCEEAEKTHASD